jgi:hypothetical protein
MHQVDDDDQSMPGAIESARAESLTHCIWQVLYSSHLTVITSLVYIPHINITSVFFSHE